MRRLTFVLLGVWGAACTRPPQPHAGPPATPAGAPVSLRSDLGLPPVPVPAGNPPTADTIALGRDLFHDKRLSADRSISCASCHDAASAFADPRAHSQGVDKKEGNRNAPPVMNAAFHPVQFWDGRAATLEEQAGGPIANPVEMNLPHEEAVRRVAADSEYRGRFERAFGPGPVTMDKITKAIASFERTLIAGGSPFDRYFYGGDKTALSEDAIRGLALFRDPQRGNCTACHTIGERFALFTDGKFHNVGAGLSNEGEIVDHGRFAVTRQEADRGAFRTPTLRNIARTAPYMHDGSLRTLRQVVDFYIGGGSSNPSLDKEIKPLKLKFEERVELVAFLEALSSPLPPPAPPSEGKP
ncbi:MAG: c-type cytochrome [Bryobacterales bacterium]|nr:c-type cytochrome [Bryobacterales bacterium]